MATFGSFPGVQVTTQGGAITAVELGSEERLVIFGEADLSSGSASINDPTQINARREADTKFGADSELALAMREAVANGANLEFLYGVAVEKVTAATESFASDTGTLANAPIVEDASVITVTQDPGAGDIDISVEFVYESTPNVPAEPADDTMYINPFTGEYEANTTDASTDYDIEYDYPDYSSAFDAADSVVGEGESGIYVALSEAESVASTLATKVGNLRPDYQMVNGFSGAQPNDTDIDTDVSPDNPLSPVFDTGNYTDGVDDQNMFLFAPVRLDGDGETRTTLGGIGGLFAGAPITEPVYNDQLLGYSDEALADQFTKTDEDNMAGEQVIPLRDAASIRVKRNLSTSTSSDFDTDFWHRRIIDRVVLIAKEIGEDTIGRINDEQTRNAAERTIRTELEGLANDRLIRPNVAGEDPNFFVDVYEDSTNDDEVNIDVGVTPRDIVKRIDATVTINT